MRYPWLESNVLLNRPYLLEDYQVAIADVQIESVVFIQCETTDFETEAMWVAELAKQEPRIKGLVAWAPLEKGSAVREELERLKQIRLLRGIRRIIQFESDLEFCLQPGFIDGVRTLADFDLSFDICIDHRHMKNILKFVALVPEVAMVLDHIGKPAVKANQMHPWTSQMRELARFPNVRCKISGVATEANHQEWRSDELLRYVESALEAFGPDRVMFGSDWPVCIQAIGYKRWIEILDEKLSTSSIDVQRRFWRDNASRFYRL